MPSVALVRARQVRVQVRARALATGARSGHGLSSSLQWGRGEVEHVLVDELWRHALLGGRMACVYLPPLCPDPIDSVDSFAFNTSVLVGTGVTSVRRLLVVYMRSGLQGPRRLVDR